MLSEFNEKLYQRLEEELDAVKSRETELLEKVNASLSRIRTAIYTLREYIKDHPFEDIEEEIYFFKELKPQYYSLYIYHLEVYNIQAFAPCGSIHEIKNYYQKELQYIKRFFDRHAFEYQYYRLKATELDERFFVRGRFPSIPVFPEIAAVDPLFSSSHDYLFSKIKAFEQLQFYLQQAVRHIEPLPDGTLSIPHKKTGRLRWTGESINLVELGYGMYNSGQLNNGNASLNEIFAWLEEHFQISIGKPARRFTEIKRRKRLSRTRFIDQMRDSIIRKIDDEDEYIPDSSPGRNKNWK